MRGFETESWIVASSILLRAQNQRRHDTLEDVTHIKRFHSNACMLQVPWKEVRDHVRISVMPPDEVTAVRLGVLTNSDFGAVRSLA